MTSKHSLPSGNAGPSRRDFLKLSSAALMGALLLGVGGCSAGSGSASSDTSVTLPDTSGTADAGSAQAELLTETLFAFDTVITLSAYCTAEVMDQAIERCKYFESCFSRTVEGSDVWNINHAKGNPVAVASETADIILRGIEFGNATQGAFDITIGAVSSLWDFKEGIMPSDEEIQQALAHIGYKSLSVEDATVTLADPDVMVDLGGIAKGYIADDLARLFREGGCGSGIINLGGNALVMGTKPDGSNWNVGVQDPNAPTDAGIVASLECSDLSVVTSGLYERYFEREGRRYHHILDPKTGYPVETDLLSASIASRSSLDGDVFATWMFLLGHDRALEYIDSREGMEGLLMDSDGAISTSAGSSFVMRN